MVEPLANCILKIERGVKSANRPDDRVLGERFLATLAPILAAAELRSNELRDLDTFERLVVTRFSLIPLHSELSTTIGRFSDLSANASGFQE